MSDFTTSQITSYVGDENPTSVRPEDKSNHLVIVVAKAHGLRNVLKMDKQSPYLTIRIQEQEESTPVQPRAGQTPTFNSELWFKLDGIKERTMSINVYHQKKNDSKFICSTEVDFSTALKRSTAEGYDGWFDLFYEGREAGKVYLEMSYYPKKGEVPIGTESSARMHMLKSTRLPASAADGTFKNTPKERSSVWKRNDEDIPDLGSFKASNSERNIHSSTWEKSLRRTRSNSPIKKDKIKVTHDDDSDDDDGNYKSSPTAAGTFFSYIENAIKFPRALNNIYYKGSGDGDGKKNGNDINDQLDEKVKLKMESPDLVQPRSGKLFDYDDDDDDDDDDDNEGGDETDLYNTSDKWNIDIEPRQTAGYTGNTRILSSSPLHHTYGRVGDSDSDSEEEYTVGQSVELDQSAISNHRARRPPPRVSSRADGYHMMTEEEMRESYRGRKLPQVNAPAYHSSEGDGFEEDDDDDDMPPPPPPHHQISIGSLFENTISSMAPRTFKTSNELPRTAPSGNAAFDSLSQKEMSWYERRKAERRRLK